MQYITYIGLLASSLMFSVMFIFQRKFEENEGSSLFPTIMFCLLSSIVRIAVCLCTGNVNFSELTLFALILTFANAIVNVLFILLSAKSFSYVNSAMYSMISMLGGMALPFLYGIICCGEDISSIKIICFGLITASIILGADNIASQNKKAIIYYLSVFVLNGLFGIIAKINQFEEAGINSDFFLFLGGSWVVLFSIVPIIVKLVKKQPLLKKPKISLLSILVYGTLCTVGNILLIGALEVLPASVQYPFSTGGTIIFSVVISLIRKEKNTAKSLVSAAVAVIATVSLLFI